MRLQPYEYALTVLARTPKTVRDMRVRLQTKGYDEPEIVRVINKLIEQDYLNDTMYAKAYIQSEAIKKGKPLIAVRQKMMLKGMPKAIIDEACALYAEDITTGSDDSLIRQIQKFISLGVNPVDIYTKLARKGYNFDQIKKAIGAIV